MLNGIRSIAVEVAETPSQLQGFAIRKQGDAATHFPDRRIKQFGANIFEPDDRMPIDFFAIDRFAVPVQTANVVNNK